MGVVSASIVDPLLQLLKSLHSEVQHEGTYIAYINTMHIHLTYVHVCIVMSFS